jgi:hypothetical protein
MLAWHCSDEKFDKYPPLSLRTLDWVVTLRGEMAYTPHETHLFICREITVYGKPFSFVCVMVGGLLFLQFYLPESRFKIKLDHSIELDHNLTLSLRGSESVKPETIVAFRGWLHRPAI